ncbi:AraC family transcriptional regulator [Pseudomaricurvus alcaniphilus]|uniref:AraC family transcriptional regulator n=1 Tax=Pseudomaricurvus alcaniphilus TaxID=1166482 RepID=UPI00140C147F|nr:AraC family transcriptional regulator [Pseudomaricurvus alcaniphilus]NHN36004.1 AraC family transcriptional regulator [Pseudomaricurvus alcaniphilus]
MMNSSPLKPDYAVASARLLHGLRCKAVPLAPILARAGIDEALLEDTSIPVRGRQFLQLLRVVRKVSADEFFGLSRGRSKPGTLAMVIKTGLYCETLRAFIEHCREFYQLVSEDLTIAFESDGDSALFSIEVVETEFDPDQFLAEYWLLYFQRMCSWMVGTMIPPQDVMFRAAEESGNPDRLLYYLRRDWRAGQATNSFRFHAKYLNLPIVRTLPELLNHLQQLEQGQPIWPDELHTWEAKVKTQLKSVLESRKVVQDIDSVATELATTSRSLRRYLQDEGTTYQKVLDELRLNLAVEKLYFQHLSVADVAGQLGFSESRSFSRAFKQWTGTTPGKYQQRITG